MKYSRYDFILVLLSFFQASGLLLWAIYFNDLYFNENCLIFLLQLFLFYFNPIVTTHNFLHTPFFTSSWMNSSFAILNSMNLGLPQILYKYHHLNHHRHNNSLEDPSSTYLFGKNKKQEHWISYSARSLFREGTTLAFKQTLQKKETAQLLVETLSTLFFWSMLVFINWKFFICAYLPLFYAGWFLAHVENYFEHFKARAPSNRFGNAVSFYGRGYNIVMFNEGYHQEHHISPQEHWSKRPETTLRYQKQMREAGAYTAKLPPLLGMFER